MLVNILPEIRHGICKSFRLSINSCSHLVSVRRVVREGYAEGDAVVADSQLRIAAHTERRCSQLPKHRIALERNSNNKPSSSDTRPFTGKHAAAKITGDVNIDTRLILDVPVVYVEHQGPHEHFVHEV